MELDKGKMIAYLQDNLFMGFVEPAGAEVIKKDAKAYGCKVEDNDEDGYFNVIYTAIAVKKVVA